MSLEKFLKEPTETVHKTYSASIFSIEAPEDTTSEVLLGSTYRKLILGNRDASVDLRDIDHLSKDISGDPNLGGEELWEMLLLQGLESPRRAKQSARLRQLMPFVPGVGWFACVLGEKRSRWFPGNLLLQAVGAGLGKDEGDKLLRTLGQALDLDENDDVFARFIARGLNAPSHPASPTPQLYLNSSSILDDEDSCAFREKQRSMRCTPAERFCRDMEAVILLKKKLTRRQWTVLVEALLRLGLGMHVLWICHVNDTCWQYALKVMDGDPVPSEAQIEEDLWLAHRGARPLLEIGRDAVSLLKQIILRQLYARIGVNLIFFLLDEISCPWPQGEIIGYSSTSNQSAYFTIQAFLKHVADHRDAIAGALPGGLNAKCSDLLDSRTGLLNFTSGFTRNMLYFAQFSLGRITTFEPMKSSYDQSYLLLNKQQARRSSSPAQPGPAMLILLVYACCKAQGDGIPASLEDFRSHLNDYGLSVLAGELTTGKMGRDLESLGLVVDSPDAAGGRLLVNPF